MGAKDLNSKYESQMETNLSQFVPELEQFPIFKNFTDPTDAITALVKYMSPIKYRKGEKILIEGEVDEAIYFLMQGAVDIFKTTDSGDTFQVAHVEANSYSYFGEGGILDKHKRSVTIKPVDDVLCLVLTRSSFEDYCEKYPHYGLPILRFIARKTASRLRTVGNDFIFLYHAYVKEIRNNKA